MAIEKCLFPSKPTKEEDYYAWCAYEANNLRVRRPAFIDWAGIAEELEDMGQSIKHSLTSHLARILEHLLKLRYEPGPIERANRERGWKVDVAKHRDEVADILADSRTLRNQLGDFVTKAYPRARRYAGTEMVNLGGRWDKIFPAQCPWSIEEILKDDFFPSRVVDSDGQS